MRYLPFGRGNIPPGKAALTPRVALVLLVCLVGGDVVTVAEVDDAAWVGAGRELLVSVEA